MSGPSDGLRLSTIDLIGFLTVPQPVIFPEREITRPSLLSQKDG